jgi:hypothetical protein
MAMNMLALLKNETAANTDQKIVDDADWRSGTRPFFGTAGRDQCSKLLRALGQETLSNPLGVAAILHRDPCNSSKSCSAQPGFFLGFFSTGCSAFLPRLVFPEIIDG